jgi:apolipoprotein N-acyltransferase
MTSSPPVLSRRKRILLCILSGVLLGASFPPSPAGIVACFGLIPLLIVLHDFDRPGGSFRYMYLAMFVFHLITLNWTGGFAVGKDIYMMIAGSATMILHPFFYFLPLGLYMMMRKRFGNAIALAALPFLWVGYEYMHSLSEWSFPWMTIGNSQTYNLAGIQFISLTGVYGLSLWIVGLNCLGYVLYSMRGPVVPGPAKNRVILAGGGMIVLYLLPQLYGWHVLSDAPSPLDAANGRNITVGMIQANIDPWEKWESDPAVLLSRYYTLTDSIMSRTPKPELVLWPETAIPTDLLSSGMPVCSPGRNILSIMRIPPRLLPAPSTDGPDGGTMCIMPRPSFSRGSVLFPGMEK